MKTDGFRKPFLITGGAGFIGSHLSDELLRRGHTVFVVDDLSTGRIENLRHLLGHRGFQFARASITDDLVMDRLASQSDVIIHLAAAVGVKLIVDRPVHTIETNVMGTQAVLKSALRYRCRTLLASSSEVYGKATAGAFCEDDDVVLGPTSRCRWAYAESKLIDESLGLAYHREFGLEVVPFRLFNTVGPRQTDRYGMVMPTFVRQALRKDPITVYGSGAQRRCFCDVQDVVSAILLLAENPHAPGNVFNIGSQEDISILELAEKVKALTSSPSAIRMVPYSQAYGEGFEDMTYRKPDTGKIEAVTGWRPRHGLTDIVQRIVRHETSPERIGSPIRPLPIMHSPRSGGDGRLPREICAGVDRPSPRSGLPIPV